MEICEGGDLLDKLIQLGGFLRESQAAPVMQQMLRAVRYVHGKGIVHRDMKMQNVLLSRHGRLDGNTIKLIDFGYARFCKPGNTLRTCVGTAAYIAPEVLQRRYGEQCALWSVGVTLYALLSGCAPFAGSSHHQVIQRVKEGKFSLEGNRWRCISDDAKDLTRQLMEICRDDASEG